MYWDKFGGCIEGKFGVDFGRGKFWGCLGNKFGADFGWARLGDVLETN
jgi:hypothetical protein